MSPQTKGMQVGGAISVALCAVFIVRWWLVPPDPAWQMSDDGAAWEASEDVNGAAILPERMYRLSGTGTAPAEIAWRMRATDVESPERSGTAGSVAAGQWELVMRAGSDAPRRAVVVVRVMPASAVDAQSLRLELAR